MFQNFQFLNFSQKTRSQQIHFKDRYKTFKSLKKMFNHKPIDYFTFTNLFLSNFKLLNGITTCTFLTLFFYLKTPSILVLVTTSDNLNSLYGSNYVNYSKRDFYEKNTFKTFSIFWKKWKSLKRPKTEKSFLNYYLDEVSLKVSKYTTIGLIKSHNAYFFFKTNFQNLPYNTVIINKPLLITPKFNSTSINKYLDVNTLSSFEFQFLRKNKVYNKGRYSRCRQNYRTGVYMCMYLSVVVIFGLYYWFYKFSFNFTYLWWFFIAFVGSFFLPKIIKYRLYEPTTLFFKFFDFFKWFFLLVKNFFK